MTHSPSNMQILRGTAMNCFLLLLLLVQARMHLMSGGLLACTSRGQYRCECDSRWDAGTLSPGLLQWCISSKVLSSMLPDHSGRKFENLLVLLQLGGAGHGAQRNCRSLEGRTQSRADCKSRTDIQGEALLSGPRLKPLMHFLQPDIHHLQQPNCSCL